MKNKSLFLLLMLIVGVTVLSVFLTQFKNSNHESEYDITVFHDGGMAESTYIRLSYDGQYEIYHGAFFRNKEETIPSLYYDAKKDNLSKKTLEKVIMLVRDMEKTYVPPMAFPEANGGMGDLTIRVDNNDYICSINDYDNRDCKETMVNIYNIIKDEAPEFKENYDEMISTDKG